jgi:hypothetical protein
VANYGRFFSSINIRKLATKRKPGLEQGCELWGTSEKLIDVILFEWQSEDWNVGTHADNNVDARSFILFRIHVLKSLHKATAIFARHLYLLSNQAFYLKLKLSLAS